MTVLVVEDQPDIAAIMLVLLRRLGHFPVLASCGKEALSTCQWAKPHLIFMDIGLPDMDGYEVTRRLRNQCDLRNVPVWAVTSSPDDESKRDAAGIVGYMHKPISSSRLKSALQAA
jgi:CheY-like chemotaxis protein